MELKPAFEEYFRSVFKERFESIKSEFYTYSKRCFRVNTLKADVDSVVLSLKSKGWDISPIPWIESGFFVNANPHGHALGNTLEHSLGYIYIQDASSMVPPLVLDPKPKEIVLDAAASPGSKTTQMAAMMNNTGIIIANDADGKRISSLSINVQRIGAKNVLITQNNAMTVNFRTKFDKILLDAPCSGSGTVSLGMESPSVMWNKNSVLHLSHMQSALLRNLWHQVKESGVLVYSTCSIDPLEDEVVVDNFLSEFDDIIVEEINVPNLKSSAPVQEYFGKTLNPEVKKCLRIMPDDNHTEGFFIAKFRKKTE